MCVVFYFYAFLIYNAVPIRYPHVAFYHIFHNILIQSQVSQSPHDVLVVSHSDNL